MSGRLAEAWGLVLGDLERRARDAFAEGARLEEALEALRALGGPAERAAPLPLVERPAAASKALPAPAVQAAEKPAVAAGDGAAARPRQMNRFTAPPVDDAKFRALWEAGTPGPKIAMAFGRAAGNRDWAKEQARRLGLPARGPGWKPPGWVPGVARKAGGASRGETARPAARARSEPRPAKPDPDARRTGEAEAIAAHIAAKGVTRCPPAVVAASEQIDFKATPELQRHARAMADAANGASDWKGQSAANARAKGLVR